MAVLCAATHPSVTLMVNGVNELLYPRFNILIIIIIIMYYTNKFCVWEEEGTQLPPEA